jgi:hypothetical protein
LKEMFKIILYDVLERLGYLWKYPVLWKYVLDSVCVCVCVRERERERERKRERERERMFQIWVFLFSGKSFSFVFWTCDSIF